MTATPEATPTDWRGTPITEGALVIYGAPVGRSIALVEAEVVGFTKTGRVNLRIIRRGFGTWKTKDVVHVGADRLIVVNDLPPTEVPLQSEVQAEREAKHEEHRRIVATHDWPAPRQESYELADPYAYRVYRTETRTRTVHDPCTKCGAQRYSAEAGKECPA